MPEDKYEAEIERAGEIAVAVIDNETASRRRARQNGFNPANRRSPVIFMPGEEISLSPDEAARLVAAGTAHWPGGAVMVRDKYGRLVPLESLPGTFKGVYRPGPVV